MFNILELSIVHNISTSITVSISIAEVATTHASITITTPAWTASTITTSTTTSAPTNIIKQLVEH